MIWSRIQLEGLVTLYKEKDQAHKLLKRILLLPFIHIDDVKKEFKKLQQKLTSLHNERFDSFLDYFSKQFTETSTQHGNNATLSKYEMEFWACYYRIINNVARTTNVSEAFHIGINHKARVAYPNIARFCNLLRDSEKDTRVQLLKIETGICLFLPSINFKKEYTVRQLVTN
ncbi:hypothetical protein CDIK_3344 [Cucumispora dikerogammari]|nr:hypothetical protein CDIK_3344 [Cucumispora dikerogammari]